MKRILAISDIHGEIDLFEQLLEKVQYNPMNDQLILLGDYVDRGPNAKAVLTKVISLQGEGAIVLKGNHEDMMIKALTTDDERAWKHWAVRNGGDYTLRSYGFKDTAFSINDEQAFKKPFLHDETMATHVNFLQSLHPLIEYKDYIFVHAGIDPQQAIEKTDPYQLMWIRQAFHDHYQGEQTIIFGHTPTPNLHDEQDNFTIYYGENNIIGIDGGAVYGGQLNCLCLPMEESVAVYATNQRSEDDAEK